MFKSIAMYIIYALALSNGNIYVGMTSDLNKRIKDHLRGQTKTTKNKKITKVGIIEKCNNRITARRRELYWKSGCGKEKLKSWGRSSAG